MTTAPVVVGANEAPVRTVVVVSPDASVRSRLHRLLVNMRWSVAEAAGGAEAMGYLDLHPHEALLVDSWLPDLEVSEFTKWVGVHFPSTDLIYLDGALSSTQRSPRRNELLHVLRQMEEGSAGDGAVWRSAPLVVPRPISSIVPSEPLPVVTGSPQPNRTEPIPKTPIMLLPGIIGSSAAMRELASMVSMVAPRSATVLIEGETGTGKELVAQAVHRLSDRSSKPLVVLNCAAIPESLLEAELFGHTRGAFTGAVQSRVGRIEAANGGTLFLDEIGEMPLALQAKMLRFLECGELQRIGDNEISRVDVRVVAATHQPLEQHAAEGKFRLISTTVLRSFRWRFLHFGSGWKTCRCWSNTSSHSWLSARRQSERGRAHCRFSPRTHGPATCVNWDMCWSAHLFSRDKVLSSIRLTFVSDPAIGHHKKFLIESIRPLLESGLIFWP